MRFQPSPWSHPVAGEWGRPPPSSAGTDIAKGVGGAAGGLSVGAGLAATVPVAGWVVGGTLAAAAGTMALVSGIRNRKVNKAQALKWARKMKLPKKDAENVAGFVLRLSRKDAAWRRRKLAAFGRRLKRIKKRQKKWRKRPGGRRTLQVLTLGIMRGPQRLKAQRRRVEAKIGLIQALAKTKRKRKRARITRKRERKQREAIEETMVMETDPSTEVEEGEGLSRVVGGLPMWTWLVAGGAVVMAGVIVAKRKKQKSR